MGGPTCKFLSTKDTWNMDQNTIIPAFNIWIRRLNESSSIVILFFQIILYKHLKFDSCSVGNLDYISTIFIRFDFI